MIDIVTEAKKRGFEICTAHVIEIENKKINQNAFTSSLLSMRDGYTIKIIIENTNSRTARFLMAYHIVEKEVNNTENCIIFRDQLFDKDLYEMAVDLLLPKKLNDRKSVIELADEYSVNCPLIENKLSRIKKK